MKRTEIDAYFKQVKSDLNSKLENAEALLTQINETNKEALENRREGSEVLTKINKNYQDVVEFINKIQTDLNTVSELRTKALDPTTGIEVITKKVQAISKKANDINSEIEEIRKSVTSSQIQIDELLEASSKNNEQIKQNAQSASEILENINEIYQLATDTGLAGSFDRRKKELEPQLKSWKRQFNFSLIILALTLATVLIVTFVHEGVNFDGLTIMRLGFLTPLAIYVGFSAVQYSKERILLEKYAFKATTALALDSYSRLLLSKFDNEKDENNEKILTFILSAMKDIYKEPHEGERRSKLSSIFGNRTSRLKQEIEDEFKNINSKVDELIKGLNSAHGVTENEPKIGSAKVK